MHGNKLERLTSLQSQNILNVLTTSASYLTSMTTGLYKQTTNISPMTFKLIYSEPTAFPSLELKQEHNKLQ